MDVNLLLVSSFLKTLKLMSLNIWVVLKLKFPRNRDTVSGSFTEISNSLTRGSFWSSFRRSNLSMPMKWPQSMVFISNTRSFSIKSKIPLLFAFSRSRKRPAFDVRFLALKSILLIIIRTPFYYFSYYYFTIYRVIKADNLTYFWALFFHPMGWCINLRFSFFGFVK